MNILRSLPVQVSPFDSIRHEDADGEFWYARELSILLGYPRWAEAEDMIDRAKAACKNTQNSVLEHFSGLSRKTKGRSAQDYRLSRFACYFVAQNGDPRKQEIAQAQLYFVVKTREAEVFVPAQSDRIQELTLENENLKLRKEVNGLEHTMLTIHGKSTILALRGCSDAIVREKVPTIEVLNLQTGEKKEILSAEQLKREVANRTGQKIKSQKQFTDALRKANRDDLLVAVTRPVTCEYIQPDQLDEAILVVYGSDRQRLIGE